ncbi:MAG: response regulator transcription factor [Saprospiraceae bacterium]|nr:response regulator transcription factor [Saprospiraceae bacterium]
MAKSMIRILVVDDEPDLVEMIQYNLEKEGYSIEVAADGEEALKKYDSFSPDLILLDIMMPKLDGVEVCREIRLKPEGSNTIIAFLTARNEDFTQIAALDIGGDDFITKPIRPRVLMSRVKALLRRKSHNSGTVNENDSIQLGELVIDREKFTVFIGDRKVDLPKKEFELLYLLASRPGKVFTREEIFDKIWGPDVIVGTRTIDVHIRKLREKCGEDYIRTVKGIGYKLEF